MDDRELRYQLLDSINGPLEYAMYDVFGSNIYTISDTIMLEELEKVAVKETIAKSVNYSTEFSKEHPVKLPQAHRNTVLSTLTEEVLAATVKVLSATVEVLSALTEDVLSARMCWASAAKICWFSLWSPSVANACAWAGGLELGWATVGWATVGQAAVSWAAVSWTYVSSCLVDWLLHSNLLRLAVSWAAVSMAAVLVVTSSVRISEFCLLGYLANVALSALQTSDICPEQWVSVSHSMPSLASWVLMGTTWNKVTKRAGVILLWTVRIVISLIG